MGGIERHVGAAGLQHGEERRSPAPASAAAQRPTGTSGPTPSARRRRASRSARAVELAVGQRPARGDHGAAPRGAAPPAPRRARTTSGAGSGGRRVVPLRRSWWRSAAGSSGSSGERRLGVGQRAVEQVPKWPARRRDGRARRRGRCCRSSCAGRAPPPSPRASASRSNRVAVRGRVDGGERQARQLERRQAGRSGARSITWKSGRAAPGRAPAAAPRPAARRGGPGGA